MVDTRRSSRGNGGNGSSTVLKIGKTAAAIASRKRSISESSLSLFSEDSETKDVVLKKSVSEVVANRRPRPLAQPTNPFYKNVKPVNSNRAKAGANLHYPPAPDSSFKRTAPTPMMQNNKRAKAYGDGEQANDSGGAERYATYTRLVEERKEVIRSKDTLNEKKLKLDAEAAMLEKNAKEIDGQIEKMIQSALKEEIVEWLMKVSS